MEQLDPLIDGRSGGAPPKPAKVLELGQEPLGGGPNEGPLLELGVLIMT